MYFITNNLKLYLFICVQLRVYKELLTSLKDPELLVFKSHLLKVKTKTENHSEVVLLLIKLYKHHKISNIQVFLI